MNTVARFLSRPAISIVLRKIVELNFFMQKRFIRRFLLPLAGNDRILDIGCGTGEFSPFFPREQYTGLDIDLVNIAYARAHYDREFILGNATSLPFPDRSFTKALVVGVFHHLDDQNAQKMMSEIIRAVRPGGTMLVIEDTKNDFPLTKLMHAMDQGAHIRTVAQWKDFFSRQARVEAFRTFRSGVCYYSLFLLKHG